MRTLCLPKRSEFSDQIFCVLGRSLSFATSFESDCRVLAFSLKLRDPFLDSADPQKFESFLAEPVFAKLVANQGFIVNGFKLSEKCRDWLRAARQARNWIAHEGAEDLEVVLQKADKLRQWKASLDDRVRDLAIGTMIVTILQSRITPMPDLDKSRLRLFPDCASAWVMHGLSDA